VLCLAWLALVLLALAPTLPLPLMLISLFAVFLPLKSISIDTI
jgi:hypothetical protein